MDDIDLKSWTQHYSQAGKSAVLHYGISRKIQRIREGDKKINVLHNIMPSANIGDNDISDREGENIFCQILKLSNQNISLKKSKEAEILERKIKRAQSMVGLGKEKLKYHLRHMEKNKSHVKENEVHDIKYTPNWEYVKARTLSGPEWVKLKSRKNKEVVDEIDFHIKKEDLLVSGRKGFKDLNRQTIRGGFPIYHDLRILYEKKFEPIDLNTRSNSNKIKTDKKANTAYGSFMKRDSMSQSKPKKENSKKENSKKNKSKSFLQNTPMSFVPEKKILLIPDFGKTLSRKKRDAVFSMDSKSDMFIDPNFKAVQERPLMLVTYKDRVGNSKKTKDLEFINCPDLDKCFYMYNNHITPKVPCSFQLTGRANNSVLPSFMEGIWNRNTSYSLTNKSLEMNNFAEGCMRSNYSSFFPKKSFNKNINMAILQSDVIDTKTNANTPNLRGLANYVQKSLGFYQKNFDELWNENDLKKFDFISLRTLHKDKSAESILSKKDKNKFVINFKKYNQDNWNIPKA